jgi:hypothetical protein
MSKILYIEDELTKNIPAIKKYFEPLLVSRNLIKQLEELESRATIYPKDVVNICNKASELDVVYKFPVALTKIVHHYQDYDLIIIDRDLSTYDYSADYDKIKADVEYIGLSDPQQKATEYRGREGDLLLLILLRLNPEISDKICFLAINKTDVLKTSSELETIIDITQFTSSKILEKGKEAENVISAIIANLPTFTIQNNYRAQCDILRRHLSENDVKQFISMIQYQEEDKLNEFVFFLRKLLDNLLHHIAFGMNEPRATYWNPKNQKQLQIKPFIKGIKRWDDRTRTNYLVAGLPAYNEKHHIGYNSIIENACLSIFEITSDCGVHELSKSIDIESLGTSNLSQYTKMSLLGQICDVILWYDKTMEVLSKNQSAL